MDLFQASLSRHAVRHFDGQPLKSKDQKQLNDFINQVNEKGILHFQLIVNEPKAFSGRKAAICNFTGCVNYIVAVGPKQPWLKERIGYYGEQIVLFAQSLGLNSCWVAKTFDKVKDRYEIGIDEKLVLVIALGYGTTQGKPHKSKTFEDVCHSKIEELPQWFIDGVESALLAPTGVNQQGFKLQLLPNNKVKITNVSFCGKVDVGIVKYHFELGAKNTIVKWWK